MLEMAIVGNFKGPILLTTNHPWFECCLHPAECKSGLLNLAASGILRTILAPISEEGRAGSGEGLEDIYGNLGPEVITSE